MLSGFRAFAQTWFAKVFLVILGLGLISISFTGRFHGAISDAVVQAGSHEVSQNIYKRIFQNSLADLEKQANQQVTNADAVAHGFDREILEGLAGDESSVELASRMGMRAAPSMIVAELRKQPDFFDPISGKFSQQQYVAKLAQMDLTPALFESQLNDELAQNQLLSGLNAGLKAPRLYGALIANYQLEARALSYIVLDPRAEPEPPTPTDAQLTAFMQQHKDALMRPEMRLLTVVRFSPKALAPSMPVDQAEVQKLYDFKKDTVSTPEKRSLVEVTAKDAASAAVAAKRLNAGEAPDAVAKSLGTTAIPYSDVIKSTVADPKVADAAFSMPNGQVSGPIKSDLSGFAVVKVTAITPGSTPTLDSMRPQLEAQARTDAASKKAFDGVQAYDAAHQSGANLVDAAKKAGFATISVGPITATGAGITGQPNPELSPKLLKEAFSLPQGGETDSEDDGQGEYFALRVDKVIAPGMPALADIRAPLTRDYMIHEVLQGLQAKADALAARIKKGETVASVAASLHLPVGSATGVDRAKVEQYRALGEALLGQIFAAKPGDVIDGQTAQGSIMVAHVDSVTPAAPGIAASALAEQGPRLSQQLFQGLNQAERDWARRKVKPTYDIKLAREAIGVSDADLPASSASSQAPGKAP